MTEVLIDGSDHFIRIEVARKADSHVIGHIPYLVIIFDIGDGRVFQIFLCSQYGLGAVRMMWEKGRKHCFVYLARIFGQRHVFLFVYRFQFCVESTDDAILKTVCLYFCPVVYLVRRNVVFINRLVERGISIGTGSTDGSHQLVIFVGDGQFGSFVRQAVYLMVNGGALCFIGGFPVYFELLLDLVQQQFFGFIVLCSELFGSFEHQVFKIVSQPGGFGRVIFTTYTYGDIRLYAWLFFVDGHIDLQPIVKCVNTCFQRIVGHCLVAVIFERSAAYTCRHQKK